MCSKPDASRSAIEVDVMHCTERDDRVDGEAELGDQGVDVLDRRVDRSALAAP